MWEGAATMPVRTEATPNAHHLIRRHVRVGLDMPRPTPFLFCRYTISRNDRPLGASEQLTLLNSIRGQVVAYRKPDPSDEDRDTFAMKPSAFNVGQRSGLVWYVGYYVGIRSEASYNQTDDDIIERLVETNGIKFTKFVAVPSLGAVAVQDQVGDIHLSGASGINRFKVIAGALPGVEVDIELAASNQDVTSALNQWSIEQFTFNLRPFNPTARRMGQLLHQLFVTNDIGKLRGVAQPSHGHYIHNASEGFVGEAVGLVSAGYGQMSLKGITPGGQAASFGKPAFSDSRDENARRQEKPRSLRVYFEPAESDKELNSIVAQSLVDFYAPKT
jgi:hypothetical protein